LLLLAMILKFLDMEKKHSRFDFWGIFHKRFGLKRNTSSKLKGCFIGTTVTEEIILFLDMFQTFQ
jgi:hypothetical protein